MRGPGAAPPAPAEWILKPPVTVERSRAYELLARQLGERCGSDWALLDTCQVRCS